MNKLKKTHRDGITLSPEKIKGELGDILRYVSTLDTEFGITLEEVARSNNAKLEKRLKENKIQGEGEDI